MDEEAHQLCPIQGCRFMERTVRNTEHYPKIPDTGIQAICSLLQGAQQYMKSHAYGGASWRIADALMYLKTSLDSLSSRGHAEICGSRLGHVPGIDEPTGLGAMLQVHKPLPQRED